MTQRSPYVETLRGFSIMLVVLAHVVGSRELGGMKIGADPIWRYFYFHTDIVIMPLFTMIAGWVYAIRPFSGSQSIWHFVGQKAQRILVPMLAVASIYYILKALLGGDGGEQLSKI